jgi:NADH:ubiquinone oxidoreductase subunit 3 (subunit A)
MGGGRMSEQNKRMLTVILSPAIAVGLFFLLNLIINPMNGFNAEVKNLKYEMGMVQTELRGMQATMQELVELHPRKQGGNK